MGSQPTSKDGELTVLVTGFSAFRENYPVNPSWEIARGLPAHLPPLRAKDASARASSSSSSGVEIPPVRILQLPEAVHVGYTKVRALVPTLWDAPVEGRNVDIAVHIGMAGPRAAYGAERRGHRQGYRSVDVDGAPLADEAEGGHGEDWIWHGLPDELETDLDLVDVMERWQRHSPDAADLKISDDAGHFLCDFIYYSSLAHLYKQGRPRRVVFFHVPAEADDETVARGRDLALNLIRSVVESETARKATAV